MSSEQSLGTRPAWWFKITTKKKESIDLVGYVDADYAGFLVDKKTPQICSLSWTLFDILGNQETTLSCHVHSRS